MDPELPPAKRISRQTIKTTFCLEQEKIVDKKKSGRFCFLLCLKVLILPIGMVELSSGIK